MCKLVRFNSPAMQSDRETTPLYPILFKLKEVNVVYL